MAEIRVFPVHRDLKAECISHSAEVGEKLVFIGTCRG